MNNSIGEDDDKNVYTHDYYEPTTSGNRKTLNACSVESYFNRTRGLNEARYITSLRHSLMYADSPPGYNDSMDTTNNCNNNCVSSFINDCTPYNQSSLQVPQLCSNLNANKKSGNCLLESFSSDACVTQTHKGGHNGDVTLLVEQLMDSCLCQYIEPPRVSHAVHRDSPSTQRLTFTSLSPIPGQAAVDSRAPVFQCSTPQRPFVLCDTFQLPGTLTKLSAQSLELPLGGDYTLAEYDLKAGEQCSEQCSTRAGEQCSTQEVRNASWECPLPTANIDRLLLDQNINNNNNGDGDNNYHNNNSDGDNNKKPADSLCLQPVSKESCIVQKFGLSDVSVSGSDQCKRVPRYQDRSKSRGQKISKLRNLENDESYDESEEGKKEYHNKSLKIHPKAQETTFFSDTYRKYISDESINGKKIKKEVTFCFSDKAKNKHTNSQHEFVPYYRSRSKNGNSLMNLLKRQHVKKNKNTTYSESESSLSDSASDSDLTDTDMSEQQKHNNGNKHRSLSLVRRLLGTGSRNTSSSMSKSDGRNSRRLRNTKTNSNPHAMSLCRPDINNNKKFIGLFKKKSKSHTRNAGGRQSVGDDRTRDQMAGMTDSSRDQMAGMTDSSCSSDCDRSIIRNNLKDTRKKKRKTFKIKNKLFNTGCDSGSCILSRNSSILNMKNNGRKSKNASLNAVNTKPGRYYHGKRYADRRDYLPGGEETATSSESYAGGGSRNAPTSRNRRKQSLSARAKSRTPRRYFLPSRSLSCNRIASKLKNNKNKSRQVVSSEASSTISEDDGSPELSNQNYTDISTMSPRFLSQQRNVDSGSRSSLASMNKSTIDLARAESKTSQSMTASYSFSDEYQNLEKYRRYLNKTCDFKTSLKNMDLNRFSKVLAPDNTRVSTDCDDDGGVNYYNGNHLILNTDIEYIAAQSPFTAITANNFWRMVLHNEVDTIVMIGECMDKGQYKYWADSGVFISGSTLALTEQEDVFADYVIRKIRLTSPDYDDVTVTHFQFLTWPHSGVLDNPMSLLEFRSQVRSHHGNMRCLHGNRRSPIVVHCISGSARTAVFIAVDALIDEYSREGGIRVYSFVKKMRKCRPSMIRSVQQYNLIYQCLFEEFESGNTSVGMDLRRTFKLLNQPNPHTGNIYLRDQFHLLTTYTPRLTSDRFREALCSSNRLKNRSLHIIPPDRYRPILKISDEDESNGTYINAVFIDSLRRKDEYILTQTPTSETVAEFWQLVHDYSIQTIVHIGNCNGFDLSQYFPLSGKLRCPPFKVELGHLEHQNDNVVVRTLKVSHQSGHKLAIKHFHLDVWEEETLPPPRLEQWINGRGVLDLISLFTEWHSVVSKTSKHVLLVCTDGATNSGLVTASALVCERMREHGHVDIYHVVKHIRRRRPAVIADFSQYRFLYKVLLKYIKYSYQVDASESTNGDGETASLTSVSHCVSREFVYNEKNRKNTDTRQQYTCKSRSKTSNEDSQKQSNQSGSQRKMHKKENNLEETKTTGSQVEENRPRVRELPYPSSTRVVSTDCTKKAKEKTNNQHKLTEDAASPKISTSKVLNTKPSRTNQKTTPTDDWDISLSDLSNQDLDGGSTVEHISSNVFKDAAEPNSDGSGGSRRGRRTFRVDGRKHVTELCVSPVYDTAAAGTGNRCSLWTQAASEDTIASKKSASKLPLSDEMEVKSFGSTSSSDVDIALHVKF